MELATGLHTAGLHVSVLTPKFSASWADHFCFREFAVYRPLRIFRTGWTARGDRSLSRYIRYLSDWIEANSIACDLVYCDGCREEVIAAVDAAKTLGVPSVVRLAGSGRGSDLDFFEQGRMGKRCRSMASAADAIIVNSATSQRRWIASGGDTDRVQRIPVGIGPSLDQGLSSRYNLRRSLSRINGDLYVPEECSVVLSVERLQRDSGAISLAKSAYALSQSIKGLQFWLIGDGPSRETIYAQLKGDGLRQATAMPGSFGLIDDVFSAADLLVHLGDEGFDHQIPTAVAAGLPMVIANTETARDFFSISDQNAREMLIERRGHAPDREQHLAGAAGTKTVPGQLVWWFDPGRPKTLRFAIEQIVSNLEAARNQAAVLRRMLQRTRPRSESVQQHLRLFRKLVERSARKPSSSVPRDPLSMKRAQ